MKYPTPLIIVAVLLVSGCAHTGGAILNLFPAPKLLKGAIRGDTYYAADGSFSISVPQKPGSNEYSYMQVKERYSPGEDYVSFGPAALDQTIYRVDIAKRVSPGNKAVVLDHDLAKAIVELAKVQVHAAYKGKLVETHYGKETLNGRPCYEWTYRETVPPNILIRGEGAILAHDVFVFDIGSGIAAIWVQSLDNTPRVGITARAFAKSLKAL